MMYSILITLILYECSNSKRTAEYELRFYKEDDLL